MATLANTYLIEIGEVIQALEALLIPLPEGDGRANKRKTNRIIRRCIKTVKNLKK